MLLAWGTTCWAQSDGTQVANPQTAGTQATGAIPVAQLDAATIKAKLKTTQVEDQGFSQFVVNLSAWIPDLTAVIDTTLNWAVRKPNRPFQYFKRGVESRVPQVVTEQSVASNLDAEAMKLGLRGEILGIHVSLTTTQKEFVDQVVVMGKAGVLLPSFVQSTYDTASQRSGFPTSRRYNTFHDAIVAGAKAHGITTLQ
jgi:hypothetical protein